METAGGSAYTPVGRRVVLQPYHPLCQSGAFDDYFRYVRRFVYWNPTGLNPQMLAEHDQWIHQPGRRHTRAVIRALIEDHRDAELFINRGFVFWSP